MPNKLSMALCERLGLNPEQITVDGFTIEVGVGELVTLRWTGFATMPVDEFHRLLHDHQIIVREEE